MKSYRKQVEESLGLRLREFCYSVSGQKKKCGVMETQGRKCFKEKVVSGI